MTKRQTHFNFSAETSYKSDDFIRAPCNDIAYDALIQGNEFSALTILSGPVGSGKTHLAVMWQQRFNAVVVTLAELPEVIKENRLDGKGYYIIDAYAAFTPEYEEALFHFYNRLKTEGGHLLFISRVPPDQWELTLPDLESRLRASPHLVVSLPDEATILMVLAKLFSDRHMHPQPRVMNFIVKRIERSFKNIVALVDWIDQETLRHKRRVTIPLMRNLLEGYHKEQHLKGQD